jgi:hypothetical protein
MKRHGHHRLDHRGLGAARPGRACPEAPWEETAARHVPRRSAPHQPLRRQWRHRQSGQRPRRRNSTGPLALCARREHRSAQTGNEPSDEARADDVDALTDADTYTLVLRAVTGAAQADGRIDDAEVENLPSRMSADEVSDADRRAVDVEEIGAAVHRPEVRSGG